MAIGISPLLARGLQYTSGTPMFWNVYGFAYDVKYGDTHVLVMGDSINSQETSATTMVPGYRDSWRPVTWKGITANSAQNIMNFTSTSSALPGTWGPESNTTTNYDTNRWDMVAGTRALTLAGAPDVAVAKITGLTATNFSPNAYREIVFKGVANGDAAGAGNVTNGTAIWGFAHNDAVFSRFNATGQPSETASIAGNWTVGGDAIKCRLIYFQNAGGPTTLQWTPTRANTAAGTPVTINASGSESVQYVDCIVNASSGPTATGTRVVARLIATGAGGTGSADDESNKVLPMIGARMWRYTQATGLQMAFWANSGWKSTDFVNTSLVSDTHLDSWLGALDWPGHLMLQIGQNQTAGETTELDAGTNTTYRANIVAILTRMFARYAANSRGRPKVLFIAPYDTSRTAVNYAAVAAALYSIAQEYGAGFINLQALTCAPRAIISTDIATVLTRDNVHPSLTGAQYFASITWAVFETALAAGRNSYR